DFHDFVREVPDRRHMQGKLFDLAKHEGQELIGERVKLNAYVHPLICHVHLSYGTKSVGSSPGPLRSSRASTSRRTAFPFAFVRPTFRPRSSPRGVRYRMSGRLPSLVPPGVGISFSRSSPPPPTIVLPSAFNWAASSRILALWGALG